MNEKVCRYCQTSITFDPLTNKWYTLSRNDGRRFYYCADDPNRPRGLHLPEGIEFDT